MTAATTSRSATELAAAIRAGDLRAQDVTEAFLQRIAAVDDRIGAFIEVWDESARREAEAVDRARERGADLGPLAGVPIALKDNYARRGFATTCASRILEGFRSPYTATVVERLEAAGAVLLGRTNMDEFAMGSSTEHSALQQTRNPFDPTRTPGGSSGGSAAAVAARMAPLALGSDTGGSVRQPAALCGVHGLKPTWGRVSRYGLVAFASSLDCVSPFAHHAEDLGLILSVIAGHDPRDATSLTAAVPDYVHAPEPNAQGLRVGVPEHLFDDALDPAVEQCVREALAQLQQLGAELVTIKLPHAGAAIAAYYVVANSEASSNLSRFDGARYGPRRSGERDLDTMYEDTRTAGFGDEVKLRILLGCFSLCSGYYDDYYLKATKVRTLIRRDFATAFEACDVVACPTSPIPAFTLGEKLEDPLQMYLCDALTVPQSLAGVAAVSVPCGATPDGLPVGLQLTGPPLGEPQVLRAASAFQQATPHHRQEPGL
ncbi:MAG: Asp-tRNA(Asn)/Glu-tRNA(Gln) amidotransferase subunit GatA [Planctomycetota bacterium]